MPGILTQNATTISGCEKAAVNAQIVDALAGLVLPVQVLILFILFIHVGFGWSRKTIENGHWGNMDAQDRQDKGEKRKKHYKHSDQIMLDSGSVGSRDTVALAGHTDAGCDTNLQKKGTVNAQIVGAMAELGLLDSGFHPVYPVHPCRIRLVAKDHREWTLGKHGYTG